jgi:hypothetical protein
MQQLDLKDRKILYELDLNCGQSNEQIGKKVGRSKEVETGSINTVLMFNVMGLDYTNFLFYLQSYHNIYRCI